MSARRLKEYHNEGEEAMRDVEKTQIGQQGTSEKRLRRRKRYRTLYAMLVLVLAVGIILTLSMTVLFNIREIQVSGDAQHYSAEEIVAATGISVGDNMVRLDTAKAEQRGYDALVYVEAVHIRRQFPSTLIIEVEKCVPTYNVSYEFGTLILSKSGRILENSMSPQEGLISITGYAPLETAPGKTITAEAERDDKIFNAFRELFDTRELAVPIVAVDITNKNNILVNFDNRIEFDMGNWNEIDYKITFAQEVIAKQSPNKEGYLTMIGTNQCSFRGKDDVESGQPATEAPTEAATDALGNPVVTPSETQSTLPMG